MKGFFLFVAHIHTSRKKIKFTDAMSMDPKMLAIILFHFFRERVFFFSFCFYKGFLFLIFIVHQIFTILAKLKQGLDKTTQIKKRHFHKILILNSWKLKGTSFECCKFYYLKCKKGLALTPARTWGLFPTKLKSFLQGFVQIDMHPKFTVVLLKSSLTKNLTPCLILIKEGYLT